MTKADYVRRDRDRDPNVSISDLCERYDMDHRDVIRALERKPRLQRLDTRKRLIVLGAERTAALVAMAEAGDTSVSELVRQAVDMLLAERRKGRVA